MTEIRRSFAAGEVSPAIYGRADVAKNQTGLRRLQNAMVMRHGGVQNRPGTKFVCEVKDSSKRVRLIPFVFNQDQTYMLEVGNLYARIIKNGAPGLEAAQNITNVTQANPGVFTIVGHGYSTGEEVFLNNLEGMVDLDSRNFKVVKITNDTFSLTYMDGVAVNTSAMPAYTTTYITGSSRRVYTIAAPYSDSDLSVLSLHPVKYAQSADVIRLVHPLYPPYDLTRTGDLAWSFAPSSFLPSIARPVALTAVAGGAGALTLEYKVTAVSKIDGVESLPALQAAVNITGATVANPVVITAVGHGYLNGEEVLIESVGGMTQINDKVFIVKKLTANTFALQDVDGSAYTAYTAGGTTKRTSVRVDTAAAPTLVAPAVISFTTTANAREYLVYAKTNGQFALLGTTTSGSFNDIGSSVNPQKTPPIFANPFDSTGNYPSTVAYHQQRLAYAATLNKPQTIWESRVGQFLNFSTSSPAQEDDALEYTLAGRRVQEIRHLLEMGTLIGFSSGAEFSVDGDRAGLVTPFSINAKQQSDHGSSHLRPFNIDSTGIFVQARGSKVRDINFAFQSNSYQGNDLSIYATHLFDNHTLVDWAYQQEPNSIIWAVRDDGTLVALTYVRDQQIAGWHRHDTDGLFENIASIPEGQTDAIYVVVKRTIMSNGVARDVRYIERLTERLVTDVQDFIFMDSALTYDGRNTDLLEAFWLTSSGGFTAQDTIIVNSSAGSYASQFIPSDVGRVARLTGSDGTVVDVAITAFISTSQVYGIPNKNVPASMQTIVHATTTWAKCSKTFSGIWHLEGKFISAFGDALVAASPANKKYARAQVTGGKVTFAEAYAYMHVGEFYASDIETLDLENINAETMVDKAKLISKITLFLQEARGVWCSDRTPSINSDIVNNVDWVADMEELKIRASEPWNSPVRLLTEAASAILEPKYNKNGRVCVRQVEPLPMSVLEVGVTGLIPR